MHSQRKNNAPQVIGTTVLFASDFRKGSVSRMILQKWRGLQKLTADPALHKTSVSIKTVKKLL